MDHLPLSIRPLAKPAWNASLLVVTISHLTEAVLALPETERLALAREIIASLANDKSQPAAVEEGVRRMESIIKGHTAGLTESQFRRALG